MKNVCLSTAYFPPIPYVATLVKCDKAIIEAKETYPKQTFRNRMEIATAQGRKNLTVPVKKNNHTPTDQVEIDYSTNWQIQHLRTLNTAYNSSPYYLYFKNDVESLILNKHTYLIQLNTSILEWLLKRLKKGFSTTFSTEWYQSYNDTVDLRNKFTPKQKEFPSNKPYYQLFSDKIGFIPNLSILDLLFNIGPEAIDYLNAYNLPDTI